MVHMLVKFVKLKDHEREKEQEDVPYVRRHPSLWLLLPASASSFELSRPRLLEVRP